MFADGSPASQRPPRSYRLLWIYAWSSSRFRHHHSNIHNAIYRRDAESAEKERITVESKMILSSSWCSTKTRSDHFPAYEHSEYDSEKKAIFQSDEGCPWLGVYPSRIFGKQRNHKPEQTQCSRRGEGRAHSGHYSIRDDADLLRRARRQSLKHESILASPLANVKHFRATSPLP